MTTNELRGIVMALAGVEVPEGYDNSPETVASTIQRILDENENMITATASARDEAQRYKESYVRDFLGRTGTTSKEEVVEEVTDTEEVIPSLDEILDL